MDWQVRLATPEDAEAISTVVVAALSESNARDYPAEVIDRVRQNFSPRAVSRMIGERRVHVATIDARVVATASLDGSVVRSVFVHPQNQGQGVGRSLMAAVFEAARSAGLKELQVPSSITAEGFYAGLGFRRIRDEFHGTERSIVMQRDLQRRVDVG